MHSRIGLLMIALWGFTYISGEVKSNATTPAKNKETQVDAVSYWKSMQTPQGKDENGTQQMEEGRPPLLKKGKSKLTWKILVVSTMVVIYLTCLKCCLAMEPQDITSEL